MTESTTTQTAPTPNATGCRAGFVAVSHSGMRWLADADVTDDLFGPDAPNWLEVSGDPRATRVKTGHHRSIWHVELTGCDVYSKVFSGRGLLDLAKAWLGLTNGQREWRHAVRAIAKGIPVAAPLAVGLRRGSPSQAVYVCRAFEGGKTLPEVWARHSAPGRSRRALHQLIDAVAVLYARAHRGGLSHLDGHPGNVLVREHESGGFEATFVDLAWARVRKHPLDTPAAAASLAQLDHYFRRMATKTQRLRFVHTYHAARIDSEPQRYLTDLIRRLLDAIDTAHDRHARRLAGRRDRRLLRTGKYFARIDLGHGWSGLFVLQQARRRIFDLEAVEDRTIDDWKALLTPITSAWTIDPAASDAAELSAGLTIDVERPVGPAQRIIWTLRGSPSRRKFLDAHRRRHRDETAPLLLGYAEHRRHGVVDGALLIEPADQCSGAAARNVSA